MDLCEVFGAASMELIGLAGRRRAKREESRTDLSVARMTGMRSAGVGILRASRILLSSCSAMQRKHRSGGAVVGAGGPAAHVKEGRLHGV